MSRAAAGVVAAILILLAVSAGAVLSGPIRYMTALALVGAAYTAMGRLYRPFAQIETGVRRVAAGGHEELSSLALPAEAHRTAQAVDAAMQALRAPVLELEGRYRDLNLLMDRMEEGIVAIDQERRLRVANRAAREILGVSKDEESTLSASEIRSLELRAVMDTALQTTIRPRQINVDQREVLVASHPVEGGAIVSFRDVTDVRRLEQVRTDFVANASHELKTPLTSVRGFAETLLDDPDAPTEVRRQFLGLIYDNTIRLQRIVEDLLDLSRLESGGWAAEIEPVKVGDIANDSWHSVRENADVTQEFAVKGEGQVLADRQGLRHVLDNLLDNAVRHTEAEGKIEVRIRASKGEVTIEVADDGVGIPPDALPRIFERFFRVDKARSRAQGGTGLGLAIVSHLVTRMGGALSADSQYGVGTTIKVTLPEAHSTIDKSNLEG